MSPRLFGVVLAAGEGKRMGMPKAHLRVGGARLLDLHTAALREAGAKATVLVVRPPAVPGPGVVPALTASQAESLAVGLRVLAGSAQSHDLVVITPVNLLSARPSTLAALVEAVRAGALAATPVHRGRGGHPVVVRLAALAGFAEAPSPLRDVLARLGSARVRVVVDDAAVLGDFDTPADVVQR